MNDLTRRSFLATGLAGLALPALADATDAVTIGVFTDTHYTDRKPGGSRHYRDSLPKLAAFVDEMNRRKPDFAIVLGDYTDQRGGVAEKKADLAREAAVYAKFLGPRHHVIGNHDLDRFAKEQFVAATGMPAPHYAFDAGAFRCIVLDANYREDSSPYRAGNFNWTKCVVPADEQRWLTAELKGAKGKCVVFVHQRLDKDGDAHTVANAPAVRRILSESGKVVAVFQGHDHRGAYQKIDGIHYCTFRAMVEGPFPANNAFALARVGTDGSVRVRGFGKQPSHGKDTTP